MPFSTAVFCFFGLLSLACYTTCAARITPTDLTTYFLPIRQPFVTCLRAPQLTRPLGGRQAIAFSRNPPSASPPRPPSVLGFRFNFPCNVFGFRLLSLFSPNGGNVLAGRDGISNVFGNVLCYNATKQCRKMPDPGRNAGFALAAARAAFQPKIVTK